MKNLKFSHSNTSQNFFSLELEILANYYHFLKICSPYVYLLCGLLTGVSTVTYREPLLLA